MHAKGWNKITCTYSPFFISSALQATTSTDGAMLFDDVFTCCVSPLTSLVFVSVYTGTLSGLFAKDTPFTELPVNDKKKYFNKNR
jgi:hypothetical protein